MAGSQADAARQHAVSGVEGGKWRHEMRIANGKRRAGDSYHREVVLGVVEGRGAAMGVDVEV